MVPALTAQILGLKGMGGALAWASLCQAIVLSRGPGKGKDCSKVTGTHPGKAWWWLLGLACLSALESGLFWKLSSQNTTPQPRPTSSLVHRPVAADSKYSLKEIVTQKSNVTSSGRASQTLPDLVLCLHRA